MYVSLDKARERLDLAKNKIKDHGLYERGWRVCIDRAKTRTAMCNYSKKTISISKYYLWGTCTSNERFLNTVLHEIAHALAGFEAGHGPKWKDIARSIGCDGERCYDGPPIVIPKWRVACPCGKVELKRHKVVNTLLAMTCKHCHQGLHMQAV
jgi:predicted SprT family Zn-dependent metalloprotease